MLNFSFPVGSNECHEVEFYFNQFWGNVFLKVDGIKVIKEIRIMSFDLTKVYEFYIGVNEVHKVRIEKIRKLAFSGFREYRAKVFVDDLFLKEYTGKLTFNEFVKVC